MQPSTSTIAPPDRAMPPEDPLVLHEQGELWERLALARDDVAEGRTSPAGALTAAMREKYGL